LKWRGLRQGDSELQTVGKGRQALTETFRYNHQERLKKKKNLVLGILEKEAKG